MYDVIELFQSASPTRQTRLIVFQTPDVAVAQLQAEKLWRGSTDIGEVPSNARIARGGASTFVVVDRSTAREMYRVPEK